VVAVPGALGASDCELIGRGRLAQPANAVSSLAYVAVGARVALRSPDRTVRRGLRRAGGLSLAGVGLGSFAYHGPQPGWAALAHDASAVGLGALLMVDNVVVLRHVDVRRARSYGVLAAVVVLGPAVAGRPAALPVVLFAAVAAGFALARPAVPAATVRAWRAAAAWMGGALVAYWVGRTGSPLCRPRSVLQPHAVWHALSAMALGRAIAGCSALPG
jgi:hypothetical protein